MGGSKTSPGDLQNMISKMMKNQHEQRIRYRSSRETVNRCLSSLIHALNCREGVSCTADGCQKMKRVIVHTRTCQKKGSNFRGCAICMQLMSLCLYHSKLCRQSVCNVPLCRILKASKSLKPVPQLVIPPISQANTTNLVNPAPTPNLVPTTNSAPATSSASAAVGRQEDSSEPSPKRMRLNNESFDVNEAQRKLSFMIKNISNYLAQLEDLQKSLSNGAM